MLRALHEPLLDSVPKDVGETRHLSRLLVGDEDRARPELLPPVVEPPDFSRDVAGNVLHEARELLGRLRRQQQMGVIGEDGEAVDLHAVPPLRAAKDTDDEVVEPAARPKQEATVDGPQADLDVGAGRDEPQGSSHVSSNGKRLQILTPKSLPLRLGRHPSGVSDTTAHRQPVAVLHQDCPR